MPSSMGPPPELRRGDGDKIVGGPDCPHNAPSRPQRKTACHPRRGAPMVPSVPAPVILFDGVCNLCNFWVRFVVRHDPAGIFRFAAQQSPIGLAMLEHHLSGSQQLSSVILITDNAVYTESTAILKTCARLAPPWSWIALLRVIPPRLRDICYRFIVRHRYQWFGRTDACQVPSADIKSRFIG
jgi:predicted DCC family thiol-disulfide oxidoreductase YuxK